jgi:hypothetical protein
MHTKPSPRTTHIAKILMPRILAAGTGRCTNAFSTRVVGRLAVSINGLDVFEGHHQIAFDVQIIAIADHETGLGMFGPMFNSNTRRTPSRFERDSPTIFAYQVEIALTLIRWPRL